MGEISPMNPTTPMAIPASMASDDDVFTAPPVHGGCNLRAAFRCHVADNLEYDRTNVARDDDVKLSPTNLEFFTTRTLKLLLKLWNERLIDGESFLSQTKLGVPMPNPHFMRFWPPRPRGGTISPD
jgi:hypothetical protein